MDTPNRPCVRSGRCCKKGPCGFGRSGPDSPACVFLEEDGEVAPGVTVYRCGKYDEIVKHPSAWASPAFGGGCCMPMFNTDRDQILAVQTQKAAADPDGPAAAS